MLLATAALLALFTMAAAEPEAPFRIARLLDTGDFSPRLGRCAAELESPAGWKR
jgi:hypothetical protein